MLEKKNLDVTALREFFIEQWTHVLHLIQDRQKHSDEISAHNKHLTDAVEHIVDKVDTRIRGTRNYHLQLCHSAHELLSHIQDLISRLPEAISIGNSSYISEPLLNATFYNRSDLERLIVESLKISASADSLKRESNQEVTALLCVHKEFKQILGKEVSGDVIQHDVLQTAVTFYGHKITALTTSEAVARSSLETLIFEKVISSIRSNMVKLRHNQVLKEGKQMALKPVHNMNNPETYLRVLTEELSIPKNIISLQSNALKISKLGIVLPPDSRESANEVTLHELVIGGNRAQTITPIKFKLDEWWR